MRRIVEIGVGAETFIKFRPGDIYLACDPFMDKMLETGNFSRPETPTKFLDNFAIRDKNGTCRFVYKALHKGEPIFENRHFGGVVYDYEALKEGAHRYRKPKNWEFLVAPTRTLDTWLESHEGAGFLESIDLLVISVPFGMPKIFSNFSFQVKPKLIVITSADSVDVDLFEKHNYEVLLDRGVKQIIRYK